MSAAGIPNQQTTNYINGEIVEPADLLNDQASSLSSTRELMVSLAGSGSIKPLYNYLDFSFTVNGSMQQVVSVANASQWVMSQSWICDSYDAAGSTTMPAIINGTSTTRIDGLYIKPVQNTVNGPSRPEKNNDGTEGNFTLGYTVTQYQVQYIQGTDGSSSPPAVPSGWELYATFEVVGSNAPINYAIQYKSLQRLLIGVDYFPVSAINGHSGSVTLSAGNYSTLHDLGGGALRLDGPSLYGSSSLSVALTGTTDGNGNQIINLSVPAIDNGQFVSNVNGHQGAISLSSGNLGTLHDLGGGALRIDPFSINAPNSVTASVTGTDSNGNNIVTLAVPILDGGHYVASLTGSSAILVSASTGAVSINSPVVVMRKYTNYALASFTPGSLGATPAVFYDVLTNCGSYNHVSQINTNQEVRLVSTFTLSAPATIGATFYTNADFYWYIDGVYQGTVTTNGATPQNFSATLTAGTHTVILQFHAGSVQTYFDIGPWLPKNGIYLNTSLVTQAGPG